MTPGNGSNASNDAGGRERAVKAVARHADDYLQLLSNLVAVRAR